MTNADILRDKFWNEDAQNGSIIRRQYDEIKSILSTQDFAWSEHQFDLIKQYAVSNVPFFKLFGGGRTFPVIDKLSILENYEIHKTTVEKRSEEKPFHISSTSGSTGIPFSVLQNYEKRNRVIAELKVYGELAEYPSHERMIYFRALTEKMHRSKEQEARENIFYVDCSDLGGDGMRRMLQSVLDKQPRTLLSYSSVIVEFAKYCRSQCIGDLKFLKSIIVGGEGLADCDRIAVEGVFGCKVYRRYSDMELGILGQDDGAGGAYKLNWGSYYFECLKMDSDEPADDGEVGRIVVTDLFNYALPMIRYDTGDLGIMVYPEDGRLPYFSEIYGRRRDCLYAVDKRLIAPAKIFVLMWGVEGIKQWQFIQDDVGIYTLKLNSTVRNGHEDIVNRFKGVLGESARIRVVYVDEIPVAASGKRRAVICNLKKQVLHKI